MRKSESPQVAWIACTHLKLFLTLLSSICEPLHSCIHTIIQARFEDMPKSPLPQQVGGTEIVGSSLQQGVGKGTRYTTLSAAGKVMKRIHPCSWPLCLWRKYQQYSLWDSNILCGLVEQLLWPLENDSLSNWLFRIFKRKTACSFHHKAYTCVQPHQKTTSVDFLNILQNHQL